MENHPPPKKARMSTEEVHQKPTSQLQYRQYDLSQLSEAYVAVKKRNIGVAKASKMYEVPTSTLRDRVQGKISIDPSTTSGSPPVLTLEEEEKIVAHLQYVVKLGYGYTRQQVADIATDYAVQLGKRTKKHPLTLNWFRKFIARWPELKVLRSRSFKRLKASGAVVSYYFEELDRIMTKYNLQDKPHLIFNVDEMSATQDKTPPFTIADRNYNPQAETSGKGETTTIIGGGSASGIAIPPFFVFAGKRLMPELTKGSTPGVMSETGWSNAEIFRRYLQEHFIKFVPQRDPGQHLLLVLDGHPSHISIDLIDWAKTQNIILFVLPAHTLPAHVLQPLDAGCYGPFRSSYNTECHQVTHQLATVITRQDVCRLSCKAYSKALSQDNLHAAFRKSGIFPLDKNVISKETTMPADIFVAPDDLGTTQTTLESDTIFTSRSKTVIQAKKTHDKVVTPDYLVTTQTTLESDTIFTSRSKTVIQAKKTHGKKKTRRNIIARKSSLSTSSGHFCNAKRILKACTRK